MHRPMCSAATEIESKEVRSFHRSAAAALYWRGAPRHSVPSLAQRPFQANVARRVYGLEQPRALRLYLQQVEGETDGRAKPIAAYGN